MVKEIKTTKRSIKYPTAIEKLLETKKKKVRKHTTTSGDQDKEIADSNSSLFKESLAGIRKANKQHDYGEKASLEVYKALLDMVLDLIPIAEENYRRYKIDKSAYALGSYLNHAREILNDLRSVKDFSEHLERIIVNVRKNHTLVAQQFINDNYLLKKAILDTVGHQHAEAINKKFDNQLQGFAKYLSESGKQLEADLGDLLLEQQEPNPLKKSKKPRSL